MVSYQRNGKTPQIGEVYLRVQRPAAVSRSGMAFLVSYSRIMLVTRTAPMLLPFLSPAQIKKTSQPTHVFVKASDAGLKKDSMVLCENPQRMSKDNVGKYLGKLSDTCMRKVAEANLLASGAISYLDVVSLVTAWTKAVELNAVTSA